MSRASALLRLQEVDVETDTHQVRLQEIQAALGRNPALQEIQRQAVEAEAHLQSVRITLRSAELDCQAAEEKVAEVEHQLYGGSVTNAKVLQDLQMDVEALRRRRDSLEERQLEAMIEVETAETDVVKLRHDLALAETEAAHSDGQLCDERERLTVLVSRLQADREAALASVPAADQELYQRLRRSKNGRPVAWLEEGVCSACGVAPSSTRLQSARHGGELIHCGNCDRILYAE